MSPKPTELGASWWAKNLDEVDHEVARLAMLCKVKLLDPGVVERVLRYDPSVCGASNPIGFEKLRTLLMMHYSVRGPTVAALGETKTALLGQEIVSKLRARFGSQVGTPSKD